jgi:hypothetical protein
VAIGERAFVGFTYDAGNLVMYKNGESESLGAVAGINQKSIPLTIGGLVNDGTYVGDMEYCNIYTEALTPEKMQELNEFHWRAWKQGLSIAQIVAAQGGVPPVTGNSTQYYRQFLQRTA